MRRRKPAPATILAIAALVVALGGSAVAASRYVITSTAQIKPSVVAALRGETAATAAALKPAAKGGHVLRARARTSGPMPAVFSASPRSVKARGARTARSHRPRAAAASGPYAIPLLDPTWTQYPEELGQLIGYLTVTLPTVAECNTPLNGRSEHETELLSVSVYVDDTPLGSVFFAPYPLGQNHEGSEETQRVAWSDGHAEALDWWVYPNATATTHNITMTAEDNCETGHFTIDTAVVDAMGVR